jgi:hypothetical protein
LNEEAPDPLGLDSLNVEAINSALGFDTLRCVEFPTTSLEEDFAKNKGYLFTVILINLLWWLGD